MISMAELQKLHAETTEAYDEAVRLRDLYRCNADEAEAERLRQLRLMYAINQLHVELYGLVLMDDIYETTERKE